MIKMEVYKVKFLYGKLYKKYFPIKSTSIFYEMEKKEFGILTKWIKNIENDILYRNIESQSRAKKARADFCRQIRFLVPIPDKQDPKFWFTPERRTKRSEKQAYEAWEQACRSRWRALYLIIKAKLEAVESGISTIEREFLYDIVLPDGKTVGEFMTPQIAAAYETGEMPPMLPMIE